MHDWYVRLRADQEVDTGPHDTRLWVQLARDRLAGAGVHAVSQDAACTVTEASRFFSFRRDGVTGRFAVCIWRS